MSRGLITSGVDYPDVSVMGSVYGLSWDTPNTNLKILKPRPGEARLTATAAKSPVSNNTKPEHKNLKSLELGVG